MGREVGVGAAIDLAHAAAAYGHAHLVAAGEDAVHGGRRGAGGWSGPGGGLGLQEPRKRADAGDEAEGKGPEGAAGEVPRGGRRLASGQIRQGLVVGGLVVGGIKAGGGLVVGEDGLGGAAELLAGRGALEVA